MSTLNSTALLVVAGATVLAVVIDYFLSYKPDPREPPVVKPTIPYIGHILGLMQYGNDYWPKLYQKHKLPIFTVPMLTSRAYIVADPNLALATQRHAKTLSFSPFMEKFAKALFGADDRQTELLRKDLVGPNADKGLINVVGKSMHQAMAPGNNLDEMNIKMLESLISITEKLNPDDEGIELNLWQWVKDAITVASADGVYGRDSPFRDPEIGKAFWLLENNTIPLITPGTQLFFRKLFAAREQIVKAFEEYFAKGGHDTDGSALIKARYNGHMKYEGVQSSDNARFEFGIPYALLANTAPSAFWTCLHAYNDPQLLHELREELEAATQVTTDDTGIRTRNLDVARMRDSCPLFLSLFQEILRVRSTTSLARFALEDVNFADRYLIKKDSLVQMPAGITHFQEEVWGDDSQIFDPRRMMKRRMNKENTANGKSAKLHPAAFRSFGAAPWLCPGRHFATTEILVLAASLIYRFDLTQINANGTESSTIDIPGETYSILASVRGPKKDVRVKLRTRKGLDRNDKFNLIISEGGGTFPLPV